ncbi:pyridoxal phosphate-dependent aminotransferase [Myroides sp. LJL119]
MNRRDLLKLTGTVLAGGIFLPSYAKGTTLETLAKLELPLETKKPIYLHYNENALGLSPKAKKAILEIVDQANRYPDAYIQELKQTISLQNDVSLDQVCLGVGSSDLIRGVINLLGYQAKEQQKSIQLITPDPSFALPKDHASAMGITIASVPLNDQYVMDLHKMKQIADNFQGYSIVYLCNPNNPTGTLTPSQQISTWVESANQEKTFFIFDEAYAEYIEDPSFQSGLTFVKKQQNNVILLKTLSKLYAMAGMRVGYGLASERTIKELIPFITILNISITAAVAATASLKDTVFVAKSLQMNQDSKAITINALKNLDLQYLPSHTNFIFHRINSDPNLFIDRMAQYGIIVGRPFPPYLQWTRVTLGTPEQMEKYANTLKEFRKKGWI